jgi:hypothetical protein
MHQSANDMQEYALKVERKFYIMVIMIIVFLLLYY